jgi:hypothetical protein
MVFLCGFATVTPMTTAVAARKPGLAEFREVHPLRREVHRIGHLQLVIIAEVLHARVHADPNEAESGLATSPKAGRDRDPREGWGAGGRGRPGGGRGERRPGW